MKGSIVPKRQDRQKKLFYLQIKNTPLILKRELNKKPTIIIQ